ncbi:ATP-binding protein [Gilvimarinus xylanilyticus]|uniref:histidine kinase n=1 Tax=Gilvimarinus xylanilyticus TaxID=2944139 RepID=A0A9X2HW49_9GAMM|nr:ATP-binding protein [Gilvimarinus xylanilyticus]MCP8897676.1 ATP-binding protein [Gilvimarinus xylanilyticus]
MTARITPLQAPSGHLRQLILIRSLLIAALTIATIGANRFIELPLAPIVSVILMLTAVNLLSLARLYVRHPVASVEITAQLFVDILAVAALAYFTGGASNPFLSYVLVPVCIAAAVLPGIYAWALSLTAIALYGTLLIWHIPLQQLAPPNGGHHHAAEVNSHLIGMWLNFALSALLISYFVVKMATAVRRQQDSLNARREEDLRDEQLLAVATQAAGTAHELGTPLSTIKVLLSDLSRDNRITPLIGDDLSLLRRQINECGEILQRLRQRADIEQLTHPPLTAARDYCHQLIDRWLLLRPDAHAHVNLADSLEGQWVRFHPTIEQSLINVLNNAAEACAHDITIEVKADEHRLVWKVADQGEGLTEAANAALGKRPFTTKADGLGIGLFLTHASIQRYGGEVIQQSTPGAGTITIIRLPLEPGNGS